MEVNERGVRAASYYPAAPVGRRLLHHTFVYKGRTGKPEKEDNNAEA